MKKNVKGITLIALVITIIVLLILAGITIYAVTGPEGLIQKAILAKEKTEEAERDEKAKLQELENNINTLASNTGEIPTSNGEKFSSKIFNGNKIADRLGNSSTSVRANEFTITESGNYIINYISRITKANPGTVFGIYIYLNGNQIAGNMYSFVIEYNNPFMNATTILNLNQNDVIRVDLYQYGNGSSSDAVNTITQNDLQLMKIGD